MLNFDGIKVEGYYCGGWDVRFDGKYVYSSGINLAEKVYERITKGGGAADVPPPWAGAGDKASMLARVFIGAVYLYLSEDKEAATAHMYKKAGFTAKEVASAELLAATYDAVQVADDTPNIEIKGKSCGGWLVYINGKYVGGTAKQKVAKVMAAGGGEVPPDMDGVTADLWLATAYLIDRVLFQNEDQADVVTRLRGMYSAENVDRILDAATGAIVDSMIMPSFGL